MSISLWLRLFFWHLSLLWGSLVAVMVGIYYIYPEVDVNTLLMFSVFDLNVVRLYLTLTFLLAIASATYLTYRIVRPLDTVKAKLNWLILGQYEHSIFTKETEDFHGWWQDQIEINQEIELIRQRLLQLSTDLQEFTAAPTFISNSETKEEIIERERQRIARELHDSVSQQLFAAMMLLSAVNESLVDEFPEPLMQTMAKIEQVILSAQSEMRALLLHLRPIELADKSLDEGIQSLLDELVTKIPLELTINLMPVQIDSGIEDHLFRIVQEALSNTLRHAKATQLEVHLIQTNDQVQLKIIDDGVGFDPETIAPTGNYGLLNIKERVQSLGGRCQIISQINEGTSVIITIPVKRQTLGGSYDSSIISR